MSNIHALNQGGSPFYKLTPEQEEYLWAVTTQEEQQRAKEAAEAAAEQEYQRSPFARTERFRGEPPDAESLGVSVRGLTPQRARYARFAEWQRQAEAEVARLEAARQRLLDALGAPEIVRQELDGVMQQDRSGFIAWVLSGAAGALPSVDAFRRQAVETRLQQATAQAEAEAAGMAAIEDALSLARKAVAVLAERRRSFAADALREIGKPMMDAYAQQVRQLQATITDLAALHAEADGRGVGARHEYDIRLPHAGVGNVRMRVTALDILKAQQPWHETLKRLLADPRAKV